MEIAAAVKLGVVTIAAIGTVIGVPMYLNDTHNEMNASHVQVQSYEAHLSEARVRTIFGYMEQISHNGPVPWLCNALREEIANLCTETPEHSLCGDRQEIWASTGC